MTFRNKINNSTKNLFESAESNNPIKKVGINWNKKMANKHKDRNPDKKYSKWNALYE